MKAITIRPPWAHAITEPGVGPFTPPKRVENRGRQTSHRGEIAIHAGATWCRHGLADGRVQRHLFGSYVDSSAAGFVALGLEIGSVLGVADLADCHEAAPLDPAGETCCFPWGEPLHSAGRPAWHLVLDNVRRLSEPVAVRGRLSVPWALPAGVAAAVRGQLAAATP